MMFWRLERLNHLLDATDITSMLCVVHFQLVVKSAVRTLQMELRSMAVLSSVHRVQGRK